MSTCTIKQSRLPPAAACHLLACDVMQCFMHNNSLLVLVVVIGVMFMCQWYCNPPAGSAAVDGLWFDWLLLCCRGTESK
jgi:hypothetical protein